MAGIDPNEEWLGHVQPVGLVVAPAVLRKYDLVPTDQTRLDSTAVTDVLAATDEGPALPDPWRVFSEILGWRPRQVAGSPGGDPVPDGLVLRIEESDTDIEPHWAVSDLAGGWQILVRVEAPGVAPEARGAIEGWEATPHQRLERLCKEKQVKIGILVTDNELRLIYAPRGETSGWLRFPLRSLKEVGGRPMLAGLKLLLGKARLFTDAEDRRLVSLLQQSRDAQAEVSTKLAAQVLGALHDLMRGLHDADRARMETLARTRPDHVYDGLLAVLLRLVFLLYAEDRDLIPSKADGAARAFYAQGYGVRSLHARLLEDRAHHELTMPLRRGAWGRLLALFRLVHSGDPSGTWIRGRGGRLFDPAAYPFLQGQDRAEDAPMPAEVSDQCILNILDRLLVLDGEKLSYRTLDVEQIGSVYETVMGFTVETMAGPALAIRAGKHDRTPVFVDLDRLLAAKPGERGKYLKEEAGRAKAPDRVEKALKAATSREELIAALTPIVDERGSPGGAVSAPGTPLLQPTDERRRTGSHYTPRSLTAPIVQHALEPAFERLGVDAKPEDVLALKVCDPAMGSGAFLVEACRALGDRLVAAWARWPETRPTIPADEDEPLHARRLVAQSCLYGVDKNPRAVELAKLSLWLATLARDHEFTFLDHALKAGDSLVGLDADQIAAMHWDTSKPGLPLFRRFVADRVAEVAKKRAEIQSAPDDTMRVILEAKHRAIETTVADVRTLGDAVLSAFFAEDKPREREKRRVEIESWVSGIGSAKWDELRAAARSLRTGEHPLDPFHWHVEFPEVFARENPGFDAIVGNPPFAGKNTIIAGSRPYFLPWLQTLHEGAHGNADLVAHFFRRAFGLLRKDGAFGLIATNTIGQGDTRDTGLATLLGSGGSIARATSRLKWPGEAAVVVSVVHVARGAARSPILDGRQVPRISAYLVPGDLDRSPKRLMSNAKRAFQGSIILGMGFTFDNDAAAKGETESLDTMHALIEKNPRNAERIFPYIGGEEINNSPTHAHNRYVIDFSDFPLKRADLDSRELVDGNKVGHQSSAIAPFDYPFPVAADWPDLLDIINRRVQPVRKNDSRAVYREKYWRFAERRNSLYEKISRLIFVKTILFTSPHLAVGVIESRQVFANTINVIAVEGMPVFTSLQARPHEVWARFFASTLEDRLRYTPSDCFETFPFPPAFETSGALEVAGQAYHDFRAALMIENDQGMTKTYNRFHDPLDTTPGIVRLRELHAEMDRAVLTAYGWDDLAARANPTFLDETAEDDHTYQGRLFWPSDFRDEVLARLLALNAERVEEERKAGLTPQASNGDEEESEDD